MLTALTRYFACNAGLIDRKRIVEVNDYLLYENLPDLRTGILYLDGEGTASAYVAHRGAEIFLTGEFNMVVFTGGRIPAKDPTLYFVRDRLAKDGMPLPPKGRSEAEIMADNFTQEIGHDAVSEAVANGTKFLILNEGMNTGAKIKSFKPHWDGVTPIQAVTLSFVQRRLLGTMRKELGSEALMSVNGVYPMGFTKDNWHQDPLAYLKVLNEADKTGPVAQGKTPAYRKFFDDVDIGVERSRIELAL